MREKRVASEHGEQPESAADARRLPSSLAAKWGAVPGGLPEERSCASSWLSCDGHVQSMWSSYIGVAPGIAVFALTLKHCLFGFARSYAENATEPDINTAATMIATATTLTGRTYATLRTPLAEAPASEFCSRTHRWLPGEPLPRELWGRSDETRQHHPSESKATGRRRMSPALTALRRD